MVFCLRWTNICRRTAARTASQSNVRFRYVFVELKLDAIMHERVRRGLAMDVCERAKNK